MDLEQQLKIIRDEKRSAYNKYLKSKELVIDPKIREKKINCLLKLRRIYDEMTNPKIVAAKKIAAFLKENFFRSDCINENEIINIPPLYRLRISITNHHIIEYSERDIDPDMLDTHRIIHNTIVVMEEKYVIFRHCFDVRELYLKRNDIIELYDGYYFMQPEDHIRIINLWEKVNGNTNKSILYLQQFEYWKSLSADLLKEEQNKLLEIEAEKRSEIEKIVNEEYDLQESKSEFSKNIIHNDIYWI